MRRTLIVLLAGVLLLSLAAPTSMAKKKKRKERTAEATYVGGAPAGALGLYNTPCLGECARFDVKKEDRYVSLHLADATGEPVYASIYVNGYTDGGDPHEHVCGESDGALRLSRGLKELVVVLETSGGVSADCPGPPTSGTIHATFSNLP